jgi:hypothetical protein
LKLNEANKETERKARPFQSEERKKLRVEVRGWIGSELSGSFSFFFAAEHQLSNCGSQALDSPPSL